MEEKPWLKKYDNGVLPHINYPEVPLHHFLKEAALRFPDHPCTILNDTSISFQNMDQLTDRLAAGMAGLGVKKGDRVGILIPNIPQFVMAFFATLKIGAVVVAFNLLYTAREIEYQANDAGVEILLVVDNLYQNVKEIQPRSRIRSIIVTDIREAFDYSKSLGSDPDRKETDHPVVKLDNGDLWMKELIIQANAQQRPTVSIGPDDVALFQYSGGTTGISKGAIALHRNLVANSLQFKQWMVTLVDGEEIVLMAIPLFHVYGMVVGMSLAIVMSACMVMIPSSRDILSILKNIQKYQATFFPGVPTLYNAINNHPEVISGKYDLRSLKACISGSAPLMRETKEHFEALTGAKLFEGYGLSEAPTATHCNPVLGENRIGSIGLPLPDVECRIVSLEDEITPLSPGMTGELIIKGPQVMQGYHHMPEETAHTLRNGWLYTGDIAWMDEDGYFYLVDRKKELIKPHGYQVWPREVEEVIVENPKVLEAGAAGIPDEKRGEAVKAWVVLKPGTTASQEEIIQWCRGKLARYKIPVQVEFCQSLPKTTVGKILRRELVRQHLEKTV